MMVRAFLLFFVIGFASVSVAETQDVYAFSDVQKQQRFNGLLKELRCLVCQNQDLADSDAKLAADLRRQIYKMVQSGNNNEFIIEHLTQRYGDFILFSPPLKSSTALLWFVPFLALAFALVALYWIIWQRRQKTNLD